jgi:hypothetical protein
VSGVWSGVGVVWSGVGVVEWGWCGVWSGVGVVCGVGLVWCGVGLAGACEWTPAILAPSTQRTPAPTH